MEDKVIKHLKGDIKTFKKESSEDKKLIRSLKKHEKGEKMTKHKKNKGEKKVSKVMREFKGKKLHSGSKKGPLVKKPQQALAIALSEARKEGAKIKPARPNKKKK